MGRASRLRPPFSLSFIIEALNAIERPSAGESIRATPYLYPILMSIHVLGTALLVGPAHVMGPESRWMRP